MPIPASTQLLTDAVRAPKNFSLTKFDYAATPGFNGNKADGERRLAELGESLAELQEQMFANGKAGKPHSVLLILQGMDTAGKGGIVKHVVGQANPQGIDHTAFGKPTEEELAHHYLWRIRNALPKVGNIGVFDRSHYEDVLVVRVHNLVPKSVWEPRYEEINAFEKELTDAGTLVIKCAMFVSQDEQKARLAERLSRPDKYWKYNPGDIDERLLWPKYQEAYEAAINRTNTEYAPWHIIPADRKWFARLAVTELLLGTLAGLAMEWPAPDFDLETEINRLKAC